MGALFTKPPPYDYIVVAPSVYEPSTIEDGSNFVRTQNYVILIVSNCSLVNFNERYGQHIRGDKTKYFTHLNETYFPNETAQYVYLDTTVVGYNTAYGSLPCYLTYVKGKVLHYEHIGQDYGVL